MIKTYGFFLVLMLMATISGIVTAQNIEHIEPPSWFTGMKETALQLMVYGKEISSFDVTADYPGVKVTTLVRTGNPNYLFVNLDISESSIPGNVKLTFSRGKQKLEYNYPLLSKPSEPPKGFNASDVIYLLMPDRFANGDPSNDNVDVMLEKVSRSNPNGRHGGDLKGIYDHLDYIKDLGVTGIWLNPFLENNQPSFSYHGYSITDLYRVDPRYGSNADFKNLVSKAHDMGLKLVMDMIFNHIGSGHWWMKDLPSDDWIHQFSAFTRTNYRASTCIDPYAAKSDEELMGKGWFDKTMPDLNQNNPLVETYLILSQDFLYPDPFRNVIFLDNHDLTRFFTQTGMRLDIYKIALSFIMTTRGIPQFYYGTEIVMKGDKNRGDAYLREDFPGGWPGDTKNTFTCQELTTTEKEAFDFTKKILNWRKSKEVIHTGKLKQFIPENGLYVFFRYNEKESVMVILNNNLKESITINGTRYAEVLEGFTKGYDVISGNSVNDLTSFKIGPKTAMILELK